MTVETLGDALGTVTEYTHKLGHDISNPIADMEDGIEYRGFNVQHHSGIHYTTVISDNRLYGFVQFECNLDGQLAQDLSGETDQPLEKAQVMLDERYADQLEECRPKLREILHGSSAVGQVYETDNGTISGYSVNRRYYPLGEDFSLGRYSDCVREVVLTGQNAIEYLLTEVDLDNEIDASSMESQSEDAEIKGFQ